VDALSLWRLQAYSDEIAPMKYAERGIADDLSEAEIEEDPSTPPSPVNLRALTEFEKIEYHLQSNCQKILNQVNAQLEGEAIPVATASKY